MNFLLSMIFASAIASNLPSLIEMTPSEYSNKLSNVSYTPDYTSLQTGSYNGFASLGLGYKIGNWSTEAQFGNTPGVFGGEEINTAAWRNTFTIFPFGSFKPYAGGGMVFNLNDKDSFYTLPEQYPAEYYPPTAYYVTAHLGVEYLYKNYSFYAELSTLDYYLEAKGRNWDYLTVDKVSTYGIGSKYFFNK